MLLVLSILTGGSPWNDLIGIAAGHTYVYLKLVLPLSHGYQLLNVPKFLDKWVNEIRRRYSSGAGNARVHNLAGDRVNMRPGNFGAGHGADVGPANRPFAGRGVRIGGN